ncbi:MULTISPECIES: hypothetical protein [Reichenbachiella]|uniref:Uncharacterized protein n=1 Tax=Reichenbachiella agariperforans TaxID=156994 RepID=A0A1M6P343_REIAG|nr:MULTISPECIES: hypothetical protein [Reichenbachiella]MBU2914691.1 hypothetical protein [Reichenbachiella agariperforans]RJE71614.1 hypothetical protein BGP76_05855 [Reichenbachiella sp. MSK19-1]SHK02326.1 hypothetical protein SAMN04488028_102526 [Reichenbachiella agariperforans]
MINIFTETDLIRYIYGETSKNEDQQIEEAIFCNSELEKQLSRLQLDTTLLDKLLLNPSQPSIKHIMEYSLNFDSNQKTI